MKTRGEERGCSDAGGAGGSRWIAGGRSEGPWPWWPASWSSGCSRFPLERPPTPSPARPCVVAPAPSNRHSKTPMPTRAQTPSRSLRVWLSTRAPAPPRGPRPFPFATFATESVNIVGNGVTVEGNQLYTAGNGQVNVPGTCPTHDATTTQMFDEPGLLPTPVTVAVTDHPVTNISRSPSPIRDRCHAPLMRLKRGSRTLVPAADMGLCQK